MRLRSQCWGGDALSKGQSRCSRKLAKLPHQYNSIVGEKVLDSCILRGNNRGAEPRFWRFTASREECTQDGTVFELLYGGRFPNMLGEIPQCRSAAHFRFEAFAGKPQVTNNKASPWMQSMRCGPTCGVALLENNIGNPESQKSPGELENSVGMAESKTTPLKFENSAGNADSLNAPGKLDEKERPGTALGGTDVDKATAVETGKVETEPAENPGNSGSIPSGQTEQSKDLEKTETYTSGKAGSGPARCVIQLASKGSTDYFEKLNTGDELQLPDGAVITRAAESANTSMREAFDVNAYLECLSTSQFGRLILYSSLIPSTHTLLSQNFHLLPAGTICVAGAQLHGKGRGGNVWHSPKGCLMFSFTAQMTNGRMVPFLQYVVSLAVIEGVEETCKASRIPVPDLRIKWPNDLYAKGLKIGGVLCTSSYRAKTFNIVVGVGLNVGNRDPTTCLDALVEELHGGSIAIQHEKLLAAIMSKFEILNRTFQDQGFLPLQNTYYRNWLHSGQRVTLEEREPGSSSISHVAVTIQGLTPMGYLLASDDVGEQYQLHPDGNSFDFLQGLVRQKLPL